MDIGIGDFILVIDLWLIILVGICTVAFIAFVINRGILAHRLQVSAGREELIGKPAMVKVALTPKGTVFVEGEQWTAVSESGRVDPGEEVTITRVDSLRLYVARKQ